MNTSKLKVNFGSIDDAVEDIRRGRMVIVVDDEDRENEGDFIMAASKVRPRDINFMAKQGRGLICLPATVERLEQMDLPVMVGRNTSLLGTAFTVTIDAKEGTTTGISAHDRAKTVRLFCSRRAKPEDFAKPGHIQPIRAADGGVLHRAGHTEAAVDLARLAGLFPAGVLCEIMNEDGTMARLPELMEISKMFGLKIITIASLIEYRRRREKLIRKITEVDLPTEHGRFRLHLYKSALDDMDYVALVMGNLKKTKNVLVRIHSKCLTGDVFKSLRCDCGPQLETAMEMIAKEGTGVLLYIHQEGRGIGLANKIKAYALQEEGLDTVEANIKLGFKPDIRDYGIGAQVLYDLGLRRIRLLTNNPRKYIGLDGYGLTEVERVPLKIKASKHNEKYLDTKRRKLGHLI
jgi:3,4-dihydroxy 2-butanone 4-phosphate synthase/GTP cyclohydrolase II